MSRSGFISYIEPNEPQLGYTLQDFNSLPASCYPLESICVYGKEVNLSLHSKRGYLDESEITKLIKPIKRIKTKLERVNNRTRQNLKFREFTGNWDIEL